MKFASRTAPEETSKSTKGQDARTDDGQIRRSLVRSIENAVRNAYPGFSKDEAQFLRRSLEAVLVDSKNSISTTEANLILRYLQSTLPGWKLGEPHRFIQFTVTVQWVLREYFTQKGRASVEETKIRQAQLEWQKNVAATLLDRIASEIGQTQKVDLYRTGLLGKLVS